MNGKRWRFLVDHKGTVEEIGPQLGADHAQIVGHLLSDDLKARVTVLSPGQTMPNPAHPGDAPVAFPRWVVYSPNHGQRWAVIAGWVGQAVAKKFGQKIADMTQTAVGVIEEYHNNPGGGTPDPAAGERWPLRGGGTTAEVLEIKGPRVFFRAGGKRDNLIVQDFKAKYRPPAPWSGPMVGRAPNPKRRNPGDYVPVAQAAKELRATLKRHFPGVKFSVRSKSYSGGASIRVSYENGPRGADVDRIAQRFAGADFDGMTDLKTPRDSLLVGPDGTMRSVRYGSDFVFVNRDVSPTLADAVIAQIGAKWDSAQWAKMPDYEKERLAWRGVSAIDIPNNEPEATTAVRAAEAYFRGEGLTATNPSRSPAARERRASSRLKTLKPRRLYRAQAAGRRDKAGRFLSDTIRRGMAHAATPAELAYRNPREPVCLSQVRGRDWVQEWYETASKDAGTRARQLRKLGYRVSVEGMGAQVTPLGLLKLTLVDYRGGDLAEGNELPPVKIERMNPRQPERLVRRRPRPRHKVAQLRRPDVRAGLERKVRGDLGTAQALRAKLAAEHDAAEAVAREWCGFKPKWGETNKTFNNARAKMIRINEKLEALDGIIHELSGGEARALAAFANPHSKRHGAACVARTVRGSKPKRNPGGSERDRAVRTFEMWHEFKPHRITRMKGPPRIIPKTLVKLGEIRSIDYISDKWEGRPVTYTHKTDRPRPVLATDPDGRHLHIVGGKVKITADGLVH